MIVGIEIAATRLSALAYDRYGDGRRPVRRAEIPLGSPQEADDLARTLADPLRRLRDELGVTSAPLAVAVPTSWCLYRTVRFPYRAVGRIRGTLRYALEGRVPGEIDDYVIEPLTPPVPTGKRGAWLLVGACRIARLRALLSAFDEAGMEPCVIQPAAFALARRLSSARSGAGAERIWVLRADESECDLLLLQGGCLAASHVVGVRGLAPGGRDESGEIAQRIARVIRAERLTGGAASSERLLVLPGRVALDGLVERLQRDAGLSPATTALPEPSDGWAVAAQMAREAAGRPHGTVSLRRGELEYAPFARRCERRAVAALALCLAVVCLLGAGTIRGIIGARTELKEMRRRQATILNETLGQAGSLEDLEAAVAQARKRIALEEQSLGVSCLRRWRDLMRIVPPDAAVQFERLDINQQRVWLRAVARDGDRATSLRRTLQNAPGFMKNPACDMSPRPDGHYLLEMKLRYP